MWKKNKGSRKETGQRDVERMISKSSQKRRCLSLIRRWIGRFLAVQWLRLHASSADRESLSLGWGTEIPHAVGPK